MYSGEFCVDPQETEYEEVDEYIAVSKEQESQENDPEEANSYVTDSVDWKHVVCEWLRYVYAKI